METLTPGPPTTSKELPAAKLDQCRCVEGHGIQLRGDGLLSVYPVGRTCAESREEDERLRNSIERHLTLTAAKTTKMRNKTSWKRL